MAIGTTFTLAFDGKAVQRGLASLGSRLKTLGGNAIGSMVSGFKNLAAVLATGVVAGTLAFAASSSKAAAEMETMTTAMEVMTGSAESAKAILEDIREFGAKTPLESKDLIEGAKLLLQYGIAMDDVMPTL